MPVHDELRAQVRAVERHAHALALLSCAEEPLGPFRVLLHPEPGLSLVVADPEAADLGEGTPAFADALAQVRARFAERGEPARVELSPFARPALAPALEDAGFQLESQTPLLVMTQASLRPRPGDTEVTPVTPRDDLAFVAAVMRQGFEVRGAVSGEESAALARALAAGLDVVIARRRGAPVGSGSASPRGGTAEVSAVSTLPTQRRQGVGAAVVTRLAERHFARGGTLLWSTPPTDEGMGLALALGFLDAGLRVSYVERIG